MNYLLDTNVLSETRKRHRNRGVTQWLTEIPKERLHLSVMTVGEIARGITRLVARGDHRQAAVLETWLDQIVEDFDRRILPVTIDVAREWAAQSPARVAPVADALIAATAKVHGWTLVTRNVKDFEPTGVRLLNPFSD
ncbi:MAG: type II toxin-antitoxin system VapC family toxin [Micromonosporaceae bacterium]